MDEILKQQREMEKLTKPLRDMEKLTKPLRDMENAMGGRVMRDVLKQREEMERALAPMKEMMRTGGIAAELNRVGQTIRDMTPLSRTLDHSEFFEEIAESNREAAEASTAQRAVERILHEMQSFQDELDESLDVAIHLVNVLDVTMQVESIGSYQPNLIVFYGRVKGTPTRLVQHLSQLSFVLTSVPRRNPDEPRREIGFHVQ